MTTKELVKVDVDALRQLLSAHPSVDAAALYGSAARGDLENHSDVDLLLVCSASRKLPAFTEVQRALEPAFDRLSLTIYSEKELKFLYSAQSLFLLHLSREAILLFDRHDFLKPLLATFRPKKSYRDDFERSLRLMDPLRVVVQETPNNLHRLSYIYSVFRVFGVYLLAEQGIYEFSKSKMVRQLTNSFPEQSEHVELLSKLRVLNSNFFTGGLAPENSREHQESIPRHANALASLARTEMQVPTTSYESAVREFDDEVGERRITLDYRLRMWFLLLVYDGLNLYCSSIGSEPLTNLSESALLRLAGRNAPEPIRSAVEQTIEYIHRYPLKYFLSEEAKISAHAARMILYGMNNELLK